MFSRTLRQLSTLTRPPFSKLVANFLNSQKFNLVCNNIRIIVCSQSRLLFRQRNVVDDCQVAEFRNSSGKRLFPALAAYPEDILSMHRLTSETTRLLSSCCTSGGEDHSFCVPLLKTRNVSEWNKI